LESSVVHVVRWAIVLLLFPSSLPIQQAASPPYCYICVDWFVFVFVFVFVFISVAG